MADSAGLPPAPSAVELSPRARGRRGELLGELVGTMQRIHRRRRQRRRLVAAAHLVAIGIVVAGLVPIAGVEVADEALSGAPSAAEEVPDTLSGSSVNFAFVATDATVLDRYRAAGTLRTVMVDDQSLLGALAAIDRPTGLVRRGERLWLTADVLGP